MSTRLSVEVFGLNKILYLGPTKSEPRIFLGSTVNLVLIWSKAWALDLRPQRNLGLKKMLKNVVFFKQKD